VGTWGPGLFSDDTARDVRDVWRTALMDGLDDESATARVLRELAGTFEDEDNAVTSWLALAASQMESGRLQPTIRDRALQIIEAGGDIDRWRTQSAALARKREQVLQDLSEKLRGPQPARKTLKPPKPRLTRLEVGDVVHLRGERGEGLFVVTDLVRDSAGTSPVVAELLWDGREIADVETLARLPLLHEEDPISREHLRLLHVVRTVPLLWIVDDPSRGKRALRNFGEVVAKGVLRPDAADALQDQSRGFADGPAVSGGGWDTIAAFIGGPWHERCVAATRGVFDS
jgi:hypothetical protein